MASNEIENEFQEILDYYKKQKNSNSQEIIVELLRETQDIYGCIPEDVQKTIASTMDIKESYLVSLIKLYPSLKSAPCRHRIIVCNGARCKNKDAEKLMGAIRKELADKSGSCFQISTRNCLKLCRKAPNLIIDSDYYSFVKPEEIPGILEKYRI